MEPFTIHFDTKDPDMDLNVFKQTYKHFLTFEHTTSQKTVWREQKKLYEEILNSADPKAALIEFKKLNKTTHQVASERLGRGF